VARRRSSEGGKGTRSYSTAALFVVLATTFGLTSVVKAQVVANGLGTNAPEAGGVYDITGGTHVGPNLFHSFSAFSVEAGKIADFRNDSGLATSNILSRVTGGVRSDIYGTIQTTGFAGTNLFLMNPAGILFGPNAQLNVDGSFHATTADYIKLGNDGVFYANDASGTNVLTASPPSAFGFLTSNPGSIEVQTGGLDDTFYPTALLQVPEGQTLSLVGGNAPESNTPGVAIGALDGSTPGYVLAPAGRVNLVSVASPGEAVFDSAEGFKLNGFSQLGTIKIGRGPGADIFNTGASIVDAKEIFIRGGRLDIDNGVIVPGGFSNELSFVGLSPLPDGGQVNIKLTGDMTITGTDLDGLTFAPPGIFIYSGDFFSVSPAAKVPDVNITAKTVSISGFAGIQTNRNAPGDPGDVVINADTLNVSSGGSIVLFNAYAGPGGNLIVNAKDVNISGDGSPSPVGFEGLGAQGVVSFAYLFPSTAPELITADSGNIDINATNSLNVSGFGQITTSNRVFGSAGSITIHAGDISLSGTGQFESGLIASQSYFAGDASDVTINADRTISIKDGFRISSTSLGSGDAGNVNVTAGQSITLDANARILGRTNQAPDSALNAFFNEVFLQSFDDLRAEMGNPDATMMEVIAYLQTRGDINIPGLDLTPGDAGTVAVNTPVLTLNGGASIETSTGWEGNAGQIVANVGSLSVNSGSFINSSSGIALREPDGTLIGPAIGPGNAGSVNINATGAISVSDAGSSISTSTFGSGAAGDVALNASQVSIQNGGRVTSESGGLLGGTVAIGTGGGGDVSISAGGLISVSDSGSAVSTTTFGDGDGGDIALSGNQVNVQNGGRVASESGGTLGGAVAVGGGSGGIVTVSAADAITVTGQNSVISTSTFGDGKGGDVALDAGNQVSILDNGRIKADSGGTLAGSVVSGTGLAGNVSITSGNQITLDNGQITTQALTADGGNITLTAPNIVQLQDSTISTSVGAGEGKGGNIMIDPTFVILNDSSIIANAFGGPGGNITITADNFLRSAASVVEASSALSTPGVIQIFSPDNNVENSIAQLASAFLDASSQLRGACSARRAGAPSSFVVAGKGGVPVDADGYRPSFGTDVTAGLASTNGPVRADAGPLDGPPLMFALMMNDPDCLR